MAVDFTKLSKRPAGEAPRPKALPVADYPGVVKTFEWKEAPPDKDYEIICRVHVGLTAWAEHIDQADRVDDKGKPIDIGKRQLRKDFYDNSMYIMDDLLRSCGIAVQGRAYDECLEELKGKQVLVAVGQYMNQQRGELQNQVNGLVGVA